MTARNSGRFHPPLPQSPSSGISLKNKKKMHLVSPVYIFWPFVFVSLFFFIPPSFNVSVIVSFVSLESCLEKSEIERSEE